METKICTMCGKNIPLKNFSPVKTIFIPSHSLPFCDSCLEKMFQNKEKEEIWNLMDKLCRFADIAFIPEKFTKLFEPMGTEAPAQYLKLMCESGVYQSIDWKEYNIKWNKLISENKENELHPKFSEDQFHNLKIKWGKHYDTLDLEKLESMYQGIVNSFGVGDEVGEDNARKLCMLSLEIDKCIASGGAGLDKLITPYNKIQANAGFTADNTKDINSFESISELMLYMEKTGWVEKFVNDVPRDIVDLTIKDIQAHNTRLYRSESTIPDQVEEKIIAKKRIEDLEARIQDEEIENHFDETWRADSGILYPGEEDEEEEFDETIY